MPDDTPFFIIGSGRSGTTLLRLILSGHSRIHIPPETWFIIPLVQKFPLDQPLSPEQVQQAVDAMVSHYRWPDMDMDPDMLRAEVAALDHPRLVEVIAPVFRHQLARAGKQRFGDKTPPYFGIVPELSALYPGTKFIHLIRDGRDVAISFVDARFKGRAYHGERFEWVRALRQISALRQSPYAEQLLELRYEDLIRDTEGTVRRICEFIGETFEPAMLDHTRKVDPTMIPERGKVIHTKLAKPISSDAIAVWQRKVSGLECFLLEASLHRDLDRLGYDLRFANPAWRPVLAGTGFALNRMAPLLDRAIPALRRRKMLARAIYI